MHVAPPVVAVVMVVVVVIVMAVMVALGAPLKQTSWKIDQLGVLVAVQQIVVALAQRAR